MKSLLSIQEVFIAIIHFSLSHSLNSTLSLFLLLRIFIMLKKLFVDINEYVYVIKLEVDIHIHVLFSSSFFPSPLTNKMSIYDLSYNNKLFEI